MEGLIQFILLNPQGRLDEEAPDAPCALVGPDDLPVAAKVKTEQGVIACEKSGPEPAALVLQLALPPRGGEAQPRTLTLQTCQLPPREAPYLLHLELARQRLMLAMNKLEEWGGFEQRELEGVLAALASAREQFTKAVGVLGSAPWPREAFEEVQPLALGALTGALEAGENLAMAQAQRQLTARLSGSLFAQASELAQRTPAVQSVAGGLVLPGMGAVLSEAPQVGCALSSPFSEGAARAAAAMCDFVCVPTPWTQMEPSEGRYAFAQTDRWIEWAVLTAKLPVVAGPLLDFRRGGVPEWISIWESDYPTLRDLVTEHIQQVVTRYRRTVSAWTVCSGLNIGENIKITFEQVIDLTRLCVSTVRKLHPGAKVRVEIARPWIDPAISPQSRRSLPPLLYAEALRQAGLSYDALALRVQMGPGVSGGGSGPRDLLALSVMLDRYATFDRPVVVSAVGVPSGEGAKGEDAELPAPAHAGPAGWSEQGQARWLAQALTVMLSKPFVQSVCWQDLVDPSSPRTGSMPLGGLLAGSGTPKPAAVRLAQIRQALREGRAAAS